MVTATNSACGGNTLAMDYYISMTQDALILASLTAIAGSNSDPSKVSLFGHTEAYWQNKQTTDKSMYNTYEALASSAASEATQGAQHNGSVGIQ